MPDIYSGLSSPVGGPPGTVWFNTATNTLNVYDGSNWVPLHASGSTLNASLHLPVGGLSGATGVGFAYIPMVQGSIGATPALTGTANGRAAMVYDTINARLWIYNGATWKSAAFT